MTYILRRESAKISRLCEAITMKLLLAIFLLSCMLTGSLTSWLDYTPDNIISSGDDMTLTVDLSSAEKLSMRSELMIRIFNTNDRKKIVCQSLLSEHVATGEFKCTFREGMWVHGVNTIEMELISTRTGKRYAREKMDLVYIDATLIDGYPGHGGNITAEYTTNVLLASGGALSLKWGLDRLLDFIASTKPNLKPPRPPRPPRPSSSNHRPRATIYGRNSKNIRSIHKSKYHHTTRTVRPVKKSIPRQNSKSWTIPKPNLSLPTLSGEQMRVTKKTIQYGVSMYLAWLLVIPTVKNGVSLAKHIVPQSIAVAGKAIQGTISTLVYPFHTLASRLLHRQQRYIEIDGVKVSLTSPSFNTKHTATTPTPRPPTRTSPVKKGSTMKQRSKSQKTKGWLSDMPRSLDAPRCPLRDYIDIPVREKSGH